MPVNTFLQSSRSVEPPRGPAVRPYPSTPSFPNFKRSYHHLVLAKPDHFPRVAKFIGTTKLHGTNASILFRASDAHVPIFQSRHTVLSDAGQDNHGTVQLLSAAPLHILVENILRIRGLGSEFDEILIVGEVAGSGVQKGVAICALPLFFAIFNICVDGHWVKDMREYASVALPHNRIFSVASISPIYEVEIDLMGKTTAVEARMADLTARVARQCPFAASFPVEYGKPVHGAGEGIVWTLQHDGPELLNFKTKGGSFAPPPLHKPAVLKSPHEAAKAFVEYACTERRLEQGLEYLAEHSLDVSSQNAGEFINWVHKDAVQEEQHEMLAMGADKKQVWRLMATKARLWFAERCSGAQR